jgi:hypothetical protein
MTTQQIQRLRALLSDELIHQLAIEFPFLRIPAKRVQMLGKREKFFRLHNGLNTRSLSRDLDIPLSTIYLWLSPARPSETVGEGHAHVHRGHHAPTGHPAEAAR